MKKIIFYALGPGKTYTIGENKYKDGDVTKVILTEYNEIVKKIGYAIDWTQAMEVKVKRSVEYADKKRKAILEKVQALNSK